MLQVVVSSGEERRRFALPAGEVRIGASPECDWQLPFPGVSRFHATARAEAGGLRLRDAGSKNGLFVGGERRREALVAPGGEVRLGAARLTLVDEPTSEASLALALGVAPEPAGGSGPPTGVHRAEAVADPAAAALLLARRAAERRAMSPARRRRLLAEARELLALPTLLAGQLDRGGGVVLRDLAGELPDEGELAGLALLAAPGAPAAPGGAGRWLLAPARPGRRAFLAAGPRPEGTTPAVWQEMLLDFLAVHLLAAPEAAGEGGESREDAAPGDALRLPPEMVVGSSPAFQALLAELRAVVGSQMSILLLGESGTGKELLARLVHASSPWAAGPFVAINCAALPPELLEAELFGVARRVATDVDAREGRFLQARGGTLFLDEIGDLPLKLQPKLLRALQEREVLPVGGRHPEKVDLRVVSASNRDLPGLVASGAFSDSLYYRLAGVVVRVPALAERREDLPAFVVALAERMAARHGKALRGVTRKALDLLLAWPWRGNVRELENEIEAAVLRAAPGDALRAENLSESLRAPAAARSHPADSAPGARPAAAGAAKLSPSAPLTLRARRAEEERTAIRDALARAAGNVRAAAAQLGLTPQGLRYKLRKLGL